MKKGDIVKFAHPVDDNEARERYRLMENPDGGRVLAMGICNLPINPTRTLSLADLVVDRKAMAFDDARLLACNESCAKCGEFKQYPDGVALYEELYSEGAWLCRECYPESGGDDDDD